jgi:HEAT repeat protein
MFFGPQKYDHRQLVRDLRGEDEDVRIFALRTIIQLEKGNLENHQACLDLKRVIEEDIEGWHEDVRFYATTAVEHLEALDQSFIRPEDDGPAEDPAAADIEVDDLDSEDPKVRAFCLRCIVAQEHTAARSKVVAKLTSTEDPRELVGLLETLAVIGELETLYEIPRFGDHPNRRVRATFVDMLIGIAGDDASGDTMIEAFLEDADGAVRARAIGHLGKKKPDKVMAALDATVTSNEPSDRAAVAAAIAGLDDDAFIPVVRKLAEDADETVRLKLLESVDRADHPQKNWVIKKLLKDEVVEVKKKAHEAQTRIDAARLLAMGGFQAPPNASKNAQTLEDLHDAEAIQKIDLEDLKKEDPAIKLNCLKKIRQRADEDAHGAVVDLLGVTENVEVLAAILRCLTVIGSARDAAAVMHFLTHPDAGVRAAGAEALNQLGTPKQILFLLLPMLHDGDIEVQGMAGRAVRRFDWDAITNALGGMSRSDSPAIRARTVYLLSHYSGAAVKATLKRMARDKVAPVRATLARRPLPLEDWADEILEQLAGDPDEAVSTPARQAKVVRERLRAKGEPGPNLPALETIPNVAEMLEAQGSARRVEREAQEAASVTVDPELGPAGDGKTSIEAMAMKVADDMTARKEREMIYLNRDMLLEALGKKVHALLRSKTVSNAAYDKPSFLVDKYRHLVKDSEEDDGGGGFWGAVKAMAGVQEEKSKRERNLEKLRQAYVELGKTSMDLNLNKNVFHNQLETEYLELEAVYRKIEAMEDGA